MLFINCFHGYFLLSDVSNVFIVAAKRTAFGTYGGSLKTVSPTKLQEVACKAALETGNVNPELVNSVTMGSVLQVSAVIFRKKKMKKNRDEYLTLYQTINFKTGPKSRTFADDKINVTEKNRNSFLEWVEKIEGKGENAGYQHFLLLPQCLKKHLLV